MKKIALSLLLLCTILAANAQIDEYTFSQSQSPYAFISNAPKVSPPSFLQGTSSFGLQLPFDFEVKNIIADRVLISQSGELLLLEKGKNWGVLLIAMAASMEDYNNDGGVYAIATGTPGDRVLRIEFRKLELTLEVEPDMVNYQVLLYEKDNSIVYRYGNDTTISSASYNSQKGPTIGIFDVNENTFTYNKSYFLTGTPASPVYNQTTINGKSSDTIPYIVGNVPKNTQYTFTPKKSTNSIQQNAKANLKVYPNPVGTYQNLDIVFDNPQNTPLTISLTTIEGKIVYTTTTTQSALALPMQNLAKGVYLLQLNGQNTTATQKIIVQ